MAAGRKRGILILGILQSGKSTLFRRLCGETDASLSGSSQTLVEGRIREQRLRGSSIGPRLRSLLPGRRAEGTLVVDSPGTATLFAQSQEEVVARDALLRGRPDVLVVVLDQKNMRRSLALALHAAEFGIPMVMAVNMRDEAIRHGIDVDYDELSARLGIEVVPMVAVEGEGVGRLLSALGRASVPKRLVRFPARLERALGEMERDLEGLPLSVRGVAQLLLARDRGAEALVRDELGDEVLEKAMRAARSARGRGGIPPGVELTDALYEEADRLARDVVHRWPRRMTVLDHVGRAAQHPVIGIVIAALVVAAMYLWVGRLGATIVVDAINAHVFEDWLVPLCNGLVAPIPSALVRDAIMDPDFGLVPTGLFLAFGLLMPVILFYYFALALLEQSGYLPRLSILLDRVFRLVGLNGKGVMPLVMGFSCITMAIFTTRMLDTKKQRIIASMLLMLGLPCAPLLSVMLVILGDLQPSATLVVFGIILMQILLAGIVANRLVPGMQPDFVMVVPPMRIPRLRHALSRSVRQTYYFMREAVPFFLLAAFVLFVFDRIGGLALLERAASPLMNGFLGLPDSAMQVFIKTFIRRESGAAELDLIRERFDSVQLVVTLLVMTFLTPCVNAMIVLAKERGVREAALIVGTISVYSLLVGGAINHALRFLGVTFT